jgi:hypothetical protein
MRQLLTFSQSLVWLLAAAGWLGVTINGAAAGDGKFTRVCAERDVKVVTLIEDHGRLTENHGTAAPIEPFVGNGALAMAGLMLLDARAACYRGQEAEAVAIYDRIAAMLGPVMAGQLR